MGLLQVKKKSASLLVVVVLVVELGVEEGVERLLGLVAEEAGEGRRALRQHAQAHVDGVGVVGADGLGGEARVAVVEQRGHDEHGLGQEAVLLEGRVAAQGRVLERQFGEGARQRRRYEEVALHQEAREVI